MVENIGNQLFMVPKIWSLLISLGRAFPVNAITMGTVTLILRLCGEEEISAYDAMVSQCYEFYVVMYVRTLKCQTRCP